MLKQINIVGGGLAGLTLGVGLRRQSVPVTIREAGAYPRHRVCGEFISGRGQETLQRLGLLEAIRKSGARTAHTVAFFTERKGFPLRRLPRPALCLSRFELDALLAERFCNLQGELLTGSRWVEKEFGERVVRATGRRSQATTNGWRWFGVKAHAENVPLAADLEMHIGQNYYVGLCRLSGGKVNVCGLFRRQQTESDGALPVSDRLRGTSGSLLSARLETAQWDSNSFCAVGGLSFRKERASDLNGCCVGDALTMIPPVTGNGMSIAFESAELAVEPLGRYARGEISWESVQAGVAEKCDSAFARRLRWAGWLQNGLFHRVGQRPFASLLIQSNLIWKSFFWSTR